MRSLLLSLAAVVLFAGAAHAVGFAEVVVPDPGNAPLRVGIWYPSGAPVAETRLGPYLQPVAVNGPVAGQDMPLVLISHGSGGWYGGHWDTAVALAEAGFVVAAPIHTGDNFDDTSATGTQAQLAGRVRHVSAVLDWMYGQWPERARLAPGRAGIFGFSAGGFAALASVGGVPDFSRFPAHCAAHDDPICEITRGGHPPAIAAPPAWHADARLRAAVVAAPALGFLFTDGLSGVTAPVQLWRAERDAVLVQPWHAQAVADVLHPREYHVVPSAGHYGFMAPCTDALRARVPEICADDADFDRAAFKADFNRHVVRFFDATLN